MLCWGLAGGARKTDLTVDRLYELEQAVLIKRICLSTSNSIFDPIGLLTPLTITLKVMLKEMFSSKYELKWDEELPSELKRTLINVITDLVGVRVEFDRSIMPLEVCGRPVFAEFFEGSDMAFSGGDICHLEGGGCDRGAKKTAVLF